jgi:hypothetical protein
VGAARRGGAVRDRDDGSRGRGALRRPQRRDHSPSDSATIAR